LQRKLFAEKWHKGLRRKGTTPQGHRNSVADEGIHKYSSVTRHKNSIAHRGRISKQERRCAHRVAERLPPAASLFKFRVLAEDVLQRTSHVCTDHGADVYATFAFAVFTNVDRLHAAVSPVKKIEIY
jgi:hypothetical protein